MNRKCLVAILIFLIASTLVLGVSTSAVFAGKPPSKQVTFNVTIEGDVSGSFVEMEFDVCERGKGRTSLVGEAEGQLTFNDRGGKEANDDLGNWDDYQGTWLDSKVFIVIDVTYSTGDFDADVCIDSSWYSFGRLQAGAHQLYVPNPGNYEEGGTLYIDDDTYRLSEWEIIQRGRSGKEETRYTAVWLGHIECIITLAPPP